MKNNDNHDETFDPATGRKANDSVDPNGDEEPDLNRDLEDAQFEAQQNPIDYNNETPKKMVIDEKAINGRFLILCALIPVVLRDFCIVIPKKISNVIRIKQKMSFVRI